MNSSQMLSDSLYRVEQELGAGGGGVVYKAWHTRLQKYVVIKELKRGNRDNLETQRNEVEALKNVKSTYLPQVLDFFSENGHVFTVMEYISGVSFDKLLEQNQRFTQSQIVKWYGQLAAALEAIHSKNIAHRDIKPANIMLLPDGDVCLIDFNAALVGESDVRLISRSLGYASPEQYNIYEKYKRTANSPIKYTTSATSSQLSDNSDNSVTELVDDNDATEIVDGQPNIGNDTNRTELIKPRITENIDWKLSDIYSLGATMYHLLTGIRPPIKATDVRKLSSVGEFDEGLTYIIESSMSYDPQNRISSASLLSDAVRNIHKYDSRWKALQIKQIIASILLPIAFSGCLWVTVMGYKRMGQEKEELFYSEVYEIRNGDNPGESYSRAIALYDRIDPYCAMAQRYWSEGDLSVCREYIEANLGNIAKFQSDPSSAEALGSIYYILGDCYYYQTGSNDYQNAKLNYENALHYTPDNALYHRDYAITLARLGDIDNAEDELKKAQALKLDDVSLNLLSGEIYYANGTLDIALEYFSKVIARSDDDYIRYRAYHSSDEIYRLQSKTQESIALLSESLTKIPINRIPEMKERLADSYYHNGDTQYAIKLFEELVEINPTYIIQQNLAILYQNENEFSKASELLMRMSEQFPSDYRVPMRLAFLETDIQSHIDNENRDYTMTVEYWNKAQELYSNNIRAGESDPEMQQLEAIIQQLKENRWIE